MSTIVIPLWLLPLVKHLHFEPRVTGELVLVFFDLQKQVICGFIIYKILPTGI
jgi:hypothetical protein